MCTPAKLFSYLFSTILCTSSVNVWEYCMFSTSIIIIKNNFAKVHMSFRIQSIIGRVERWFLPSVASHGSDIPLGNCIKGAEI